MTASPVCVLFALPHEAAPLRRRLRDGPIAGLDVRIECSGVGAARAGEAAARLVASLPEPPLCILICGFAGGLAPGVSIADVVVAESVLSAPGGLAGDARLFPAARLVSAASALVASHGVQRSGTLLTVERIAVTTEQKRALHAATGAIAVDMETAGAAPAAERLGVPWLAVRSVTDMADTDLPLDFEALAGPNGAPDGRRVIVATLRRPWLIPPVIRLGAHSARAANALADYLYRLLEALAGEAV